MAEQLYLKVYLTNLGKYNEGKLIGNWVDVEGADWEEELKKIGVSDEPDEKGNYYEEYFITDYDTNIDGIASELGEYPSLDTLALIGDNLYEINKNDPNKFEAVVESGFAGSILDAIEKYEDYLYIDDVSSDEDLAYAYIDEIYDGNVSEVANADNYFDYAGYGRDFAIEDPDYIDEMYGEDEAPDDETVGEDLINNFGGLKELSQEEKERYFDYDQFGRDLSFDGTFAGNGFLFNQ